MNNKFNINKENFTKNNQSLNTERAFASSAAVLQNSNTGIIIPLFNVHINHKKLYEIKTNKNFLEEESNTILPRLQLSSAQKNSNFKFNSNLYTKALKKYNYNLDIENLHLNSSTSPSHASKKELIGVIKREENSMYPAEEINKIYNNYLFLINRYLPYNIYFNRLMKLGIFLPHLIFKPQFYSNKYKFKNTLSFSLADEAAKLLLPISAYYNKILSAIALNIRAKQIKSFNLSKNNNILNNFDQSEVQDLPTPEQIEKQKAEELEKKLNKYYPIKRNKKNKKPTTFLFRSRYHILVRIKKKNLALDFKYKKHSLKNNPILINISNNIFNIFTNKIITPVLSTGRRNPDQLDFFGNPYNLYLRYTKLKYNKILLNNNIFVLNKNASNLTPFVYEDFLLENKKDSLLPAATSIPTVELTKKDNVKILLNNVVEKGNSLINELNSLILEKNILINKNKINNFFFDFNNINSNKNISNNIFTNNSIAQTGLATESFNTITNNTNILQDNKQTHILNQYLKSISVYNMKKKGILIHYNNLINYNFVKGSLGYLNRLLFKVYKLLETSFKAMHCLISKPVFIVTPNKIIIRLFYFLFIPNILKYKKIISIRNNRYKGKFKKRNRRSRLTYSQKKQYNKFRKLKTDIRIRLRNLSNTALTNVFSNKFKILSIILSKLFKKPVEFDLTRLHYAYNDSNILVNLLGIMINKIKLRIIIRRLFLKAVIKNLSKLPITRKKNINLDKGMQADPSLIIPSFLSGIKIKVGGRLLTHSVVPRQTVKITQRGATQRGKINFLDVARYTRKNKRGAFSITVKSGQNIF